MKYLCISNFSGAFASAGGHDAAGVCGAEGGGAEAQCSVAIPRPTSTTALLKHDHNARPRRNTNVFISLVLTL
jgi:hypothetical protein